MNNESIEIVIKAVVDLLRFLPHDVNFMQLRYCAIPPRRTRWFIPIAPPINWMNHRTDDLLQPNVEYDMVELSLREIGDRTVYVGYSERTNILVFSEP